VTEIKETLQILKARWQEASLLIGLGFLASLFTGILRVHRGYRLWIVFICIDGMLLIVQTLLYLGFLRTVYLESDKQQSPLNLLQKGKHFFWRLCGLGLLYIIVLSILLRVIFWIVKIVTPIDGSLKEVAPIVGQLCLSIAMLILIKVSLLIPALIIVLDCGAFESFKFIKKCRLRDAGELIALFCFQVASPLLGAFLPKLAEAKTILQYTLGIIPSTILYFISFIVSVMAVRFVASLGLVHDEQPRVLDFEDLRKYSNRDLKE